MIIVITGSNGKTTTLHLIESQLGDRAKYSHLANSAFGLPFDILGLKGVTKSRLEWIKLFALAPFMIFTPVPKQKIYVAEADCSRPKEGRFLAALLKPDITIWSSLAHSHSRHFIKYTRKWQVGLEEAIARGFGYFLKQTKNKVIINGDEPLIVKQTNGLSAEVFQIKQAGNLESYKLDLTGSHFLINGQAISLPALLPRESYYSIVACQHLTELLGAEFDPSYSRLILPPGRSSVLAGINQTSLIDSSYNANLGSVKTILEMVKAIKAKSKWLVLGDIIDQGKLENQEHRQLAKLINQIESYDHIILIGRRLRQITAPLIKDKPGQTVKLFANTTEASNYIKASIPKGALVVFKGSQFLESLIESLLANPADEKYLCRRQDHNQRRKQKWQGTK